MSIFSGFSVVLIKIILYLFIFSKEFNKYGNNDPCGLLLPSLLDITSISSNKITAGTFSLHPSKIFLNFSQPSLEIRLVQLIAKAVKPQLFFRYESIQFPNIVLPEPIGPHIKNPLFSYVSPISLKCSSSEKGSNIYFYTYFNVSLIPPKFSNLQLSSS